MTDNKKYEKGIEKIRKGAIVEIKEKVKRNPGYLHPCNKERQEDMKRLKFTNGYSFTCWMQRNGIMKNPTDIKHMEMEKAVIDAGCDSVGEYLDKCALEEGFKSNTERCREHYRDNKERHRNDQRKLRHESGINSPMEDNPDCAAWFGSFICENYVIKTFEDPIKMPYGNPGYDWICKRGEKIDHKGACLTYSSHRSPKWIFSIRYNNTADWFILSAWNNRNSLTPLHMWMFHKSDMVRGRKFWRRETFTIINTPEGLIEFEKYEVTDRLERLKELCNKR